MKAASIPAILAAIVLSPVAAKSDERPPEGARTMLEVVTLLEKDGYAPITEISFDDAPLGGWWEVEAVKNDVDLELNVDTLTVKIASEHPDDPEARPAKHLLPLSKVLTSLEDAGWTSVVEASYERNTWEVEAYEGDEKHELRVDAVSGKIVRDRVDD